MDSAVHNVPFEHDPTGYKSGAFVPQHSVAGQKLNYRMRTTPEGMTLVFQDQLFYLILQSCASALGGLKGPFMGMHLPAESCLIDTLKLTCS